MKLTDYLLPSLVKVPMAAVRKQDAIIELVDLVAAQGLIASPEATLKAILDREAQRSTGIGRGFAIPHAKCDTVDRLVIAFGRTAGPIDFGAIDGRPVSLIALLLSPTNAPGLHIQALARLTRMVTIETVLDALLSAANDAEFYRVIGRCDV